MNGSSAEQGRKIKNFSKVINLHIPIEESQSISYDTKNTGLNKLEHLGVADW